MMKIQYNYFAYNSIQEANGLLDNFKTISELQHNKVSQKLRNMKKNNKIFIYEQ